MGATHAAVYRLLPSVQVVAIVDPRLEETRTALATKGWEIPVFSDYASAAAAGDFSVVDICLPTDLHLEMALKAFSDGCHVFCEKPIALTVGDAEKMVQAGVVACRQLMIGHCIRFWPEYVELKRVVDSGEHGRLLSLSMSRRTGRPGYTAGDWVNRPERCLGAALDLHIHDTDFLVFLLGLPEAVTSRGIQETTGWNSITSQYQYGQLQVTAEGAWNYPKNWGFQMRFSAVFERAVLDFDSRAISSLMLTVGDQPPMPVTSPLAAGVPANIAGLGGYYHELAYFTQRLKAGLPVDISNGQQATQSLRVVLAEIESARSGKIIILNQ
jgi:predicted dehydrogenase